MAVALAAASTRAAAASAAARASLAAVMSGGASIGAFVVVACNGGALDTAFNARTPAPPPPSSSSSSAGEPTSMGARTLLGVLRTLKPTSCRRCSPLAAIAAGFGGGICARSSAAVKATDAASDTKCWREPGTPLPELARSERPSHGFEEPSAGRQSEGSPDALALAPWPSAAVVEDRGRSAGFFGETCSPSSRAFFL